MNIKKPQLPDKITSKNFKETLYEALLVAFGKILSKYNVFAQGSILKDVGREIIDYLNGHGYTFEETGKMDDLTTRRTYSLKTALLINSMSKNRRKATNILA